MGQDPSNYVNEKIAESRTIIGRVGVFDSIVVPISRNSAIWKDLQASKVIYVKLKVTGEAASVSVAATQGEILDLYMGKRYFIDLEGSERFRFSTSVVKTEGNHHYKFVAEPKTSTGPITITGYGKKGHGDATPENKNFEMIHYGKDKLGYVIDHTDPIYCTAGTCTYSLTVHMTNVKILDLYLAEHIDVEPLIDGDHTVNIRLTLDRLHQGRVTEDQPFHLSSRQLGQQSHLHFDSDRRIG